MIQIFDPGQKEKKRVKKMKKIEYDIKKIITNESNNKNTITDWSLSDDPFYRFYGVW